MSQPALQPRYEVVDFAAIEGVACPCGVARRAFADVEDYPGTIHVTEISADAQTHYHRTLTETYYFSAGPTPKCSLMMKFCPCAPGCA
jgi:hypothetical protein